MTSEQDRDALEQWLERRWMGRDVGVLVEAGLGSLAALRAAPPATVIALFAKPGHRLKMRLMLRDLSAAAEEDPGAPPPPAEEPAPPAEEPEPPAEPAPEPGAEPEPAEEEPQQEEEEEEDMMPPVLMADSDDSDMEDEVLPAPEDSDSDEEGADGAEPTASPEPAYGQAEDIPVPLEAPPVPPVPAGAQGAPPEQAEAGALPDLPDSDGEEEGEAAEAPQGEAEPEPEAGAAAAAPQSAFQKRLAMFEQQKAADAAAGPAAAEQRVATDPTPKPVKVSASADLLSRMGNVAAALAKGPPVKAKKAQPAREPEAERKAPPPLPPGAAPGVAPGAAAGESRAVSGSASSASLYQGDFDVEDDEAPAGFELPPVSALGGAEKRGVLEKRGVGYVNRQFKERFMVLKGRDLYWLKAQGDEFPAGAIRLTEPGIQLKLLDASTLEVRTKKKTYVFRADTDESMSSWLQAMRMAQNKHRGKRGSVVATRLSEVLDDESRRLVGILKLGTMFIKYKHKKGKERMIWVPASMDRVVWGLRDKKTAKGFLLLKDVVRISEGCFGSTRNENAFTLVSRQRTLELEATSAQEKADWVAGFNFLLSNKERLA